MRDRRQETGESQVCTVPFTVLYCTGKSELYNTLLYNKLSKVEKFLDIDIVEYCTLDSNNDIIKRIYCYLMNVHSRIYVRTSLASVLSASLQTSFLHFYFQFDATTCVLVIVTSDYTSYCSLQALNTMACLFVWSTVPSPLEKH